MADEAEPTPTPDVVVIEVEKNAERTAKEPDVQINDYDWSYEVLATYAKMYYGLNTKLEKQVATAICVNRYFSGKKNPDGTPMFGDGSIEGMVKARGEFDFYDPEYYVNDNNLELAERFLNVCFTNRLTDQYTGFIFPKSALYFGWTEDRSIAVYAERGAEPLHIFENKGY